MNNQIYTIAAILFCLLLGYGINYLIPAMPASLFGLLCFTCLLKLNVIKAKKVENSVQWGIRNMGVCFVPAGVGIMEQFDLLKDYGITMLVLCVATTLLLMWLVGYSYQRAQKNTTKELATHIDAKEQN